SAWYPRYRRQGWKRRKYWCRRYRSDHKSYSRSDPHGPSGAYRGRRRHWYLFYWNPRQQILFAGLFAYRLQPDHHGWGTDPPAGTHRHALLYVFGLPETG